MRHVVGWTAPAVKLLFAVAMLDVGIVATAWPNVPLTAAAVAVSVLWWVSVYRAFQKARSSADPG